ncbi:MAG TPA: hypothetical protein IAB23_05615 [Candidatus Scybalocola faecavium]|nr:hypothetical protein [Candidatus Scybalocola faecavium]
MDQQMHIKDSMLMLEFDDQEAQLVPSGHLYSMWYGHRLSFYGLENLMEKMKRIYYLMEISSDDSGYPSAFPTDNPFFVSETCLEGKAQWYSHRDIPSNMEPERWENCLMIRSLNRKENCWQGQLMEKDRQWNYNSAHELTELLSQVWLMMKGRRLTFFGSL